MAAVVELGAAWLCEAEGEMVFLRHRTFVHREGLLGEALQAEEALATMDVTLDYTGVLGLLYDRPGVDLSLVRLAVVVWDLAHVSGAATSTDRPWAAAARDVISRMVGLVAVVARLGRAELMAFDLAMVARAGAETGMSDRRIRSVVQGRMHHNTSGATAVAAWCLVRPSIVAQLPTDVATAVRCAAEAVHAPLYAACLMGGRHREETRSMLRALGARRTAEDLADGAETFSEVEWMGLLRQVRPRLA